VPTLLECRAELRARVGHLSGALEDIGRALRLREGDSLKPDSDSEADAHCGDGAEAEGG
jgi:hypothetical protein